MARPPRPTSGSPLSPGQAHYVLEQLIRERRISPGEINRYVGDMGREISDLESRLQRLRDAHGGGSSSSSSSSAGSSSSSSAAAPAKRGPGRPPGSGRGPGRPPGSGRGPGRPAGSGRGPGRPPASANTASSASAAAPAAAPSKGGKQGGRKSRSAITPEQLASRQLQGRYLGLVRRFPESKRAYYAKVAKEKGREAAIKEMTDNAKK
jgi:hypothetical protein